MLAANRDPHHEIAAGGGREHEADGEVRMDERRTIAGAGLP